MYHGIYRNIRNLYKWPPESMDRLPIQRICKIYEEIQEDLEKREQAGS